VVFGYGSLLWNPGFEPAETVTATLSGYHRSFACCRSIIAGPSNNKLALAFWTLATRFCTGVAAFGVRVIAELRERELISSAYEEGIYHWPLKMAATFRRWPTSSIATRTILRQFDLERQAQMIARSVATRARTPNIYTILPTIWSKWASTTHGCGLS
jgi:cation transport protein ChaC